MAATFAELDPHNSISDSLKTDINLTIHIVNEYMDGNPMLRQLQHHRLPLFDNLGDDRSVGPFERAHRPRHDLGKRNTDTDGTAVCDNGTNINAVE